MALLHAQALAITALFATHSQPDQLRTAFAKLVDTDDSAYEMEASLLFLATVDSFRRSIPSH